MKKERREKEKELVCQEEKSFSTIKIDVDGNANKELKDIPEHSRTSDVRKEQINVDECQDEKKMPDKVAVNTVNMLNLDIGTLAISEYRGFSLIFSKILQSKSEHCGLKDNEPITICKQIRSV